MRIVNQLDEIPHPSRANGSVALDTFWERAAETRWGQYVSALESQALQAAHDRFAAPAVGLEVGCDGGRWCRFLAERGWQMIATDVNPDSLRRCRERNHSIRCLLVGETDQVLPVDCQSIDLLVCIEVPEVIHRPWFLAEANRVLKSNGILVGSFFNLLSWRGVAAQLKSFMIRTPRYYYSTYASFRNTLPKHGFSVTHETGCCWSPFRRKSDSRLIPLATGLERRLGLNRLTSLSPWIVFTATRSGLA
jgi:SAM-dependent methyltransferase